MNGDIKDFKNELKALLEKHGVYFDFLASDCSDWHGINDYRLSICDSKTDKEIERFDYQTDLSASDL